MTTVEKRTRRAPGFAVMAFVRHAEIAANAVE
jgi:hypothetical protein